MAKYLILAGQYEGQLRDYGNMDTAAQKRRKLHLVDYDTYKSLSDVEKAVYLSEAQTSAGIEVSAEDKKKAVAQAAVKEKKTKAEDVAVVEETQAIEEIAEENIEAAEVAIDEAAELLQLQQAYEKQEGKQVPSRFKNNAEWIKTKLS